ncbi:hypothetical protein EON65_03495 [archaeon]|nr:MAG: hypothetical protein EON65_03495 [archaeon]
MRADYTTKIRSKDRADRQLGVAMWVIDVLALRVGGEKGEDEADTVGCCSLRYRVCVWCSAWPGVLHGELRWLAWRVWLNVRMVYSIYDV